MIFVINAYFYYFESLSSFYYNLLILLKLNRCCIWPFKKIYRNMKRPIFLYPLILLHAFLGMGAFAGGAMLLIKSDGSLLGMEPKWLEHSPFDNYLLPGFILFTINGLLPLLTLVGLLIKPVWRWPSLINVYTDRHWAWAYSLYSGVIVIIWITVQQIMTQYFWLQPVMIFTGLLIIVFSLFPSVMKYFYISNI